MEKQPAIELEAPVEKYIPFILEIRKRLFFTISAFLISSVIGFFYYEKIITLSLKLFNLTGVNVVFTSPFQFFTLALTVGFCIGLIIVFPFIIFQVMSFLKPALNPHEYKTIAYLIPLSLVLFSTGFAFGIVIMRYILIIFYTKSQSLDIGNFLDISLLLSQTLFTSVLMGFAFQAPIVLTILMRLKVVKYKTFVKGRVIAYIASLIFAALLPPTDLLSLFLLFLPIVMFYELTLLLNRWLLKSHLL